MEMNTRETTCFRFIGSSIFVLALHIADKSSSLYSIARHDEQKYDFSVMIIHFDPRHIQTRLQMEYVDDWYLSSQAARSHA